MAAKKKSSFVEEKAPPVKTGQLKSLPLKLLLMVLAVIGIGVGIYFYLRSVNTQKMLKDPLLAAKLEQQTLVEKVGKMVDLPKDEEATIATVSDVTKLKDQSFFAKAKNGFKVLIYPKNKKAVLYDPSTNKIVEIGPINIDESQGSATATSPTAPPKVVETVTVALYNGTKVVGLARTVEGQLKEKASNVRVVSKGNARQDYTKTLVVDLTGKKKDVASQLANLLNGEVGPHPKGEVKPSSSSADILILLGK